MSKEISIIIVKYILAGWGVSTYYYYHHKDTTRTKDSQRKLLNSG